ICILMSESRTWKGGDRCRATRGTSGHAPGHARSGPGALRGPCPACATSNPASQKGRAMPATTFENDYRLTSTVYTLDRQTDLLGERGRAQGARPLPRDLLRAMASELPLYRRHARSTLPAQVQRSAFAMYRRQVEILRDRIRARKRNPILYNAADFAR